MGLYLAKFLYSLCMLTLRHAAFPLQPGKFMEPDLLPWRKREYSGFRSRSSKYSSGKPVSWCKTVAPKSATKRREKKHREACFQLKSPFLFALSLTHTHTQHAPKTIRKWQQAHRKWYQNPSLRKVAGEMGNLQYENLFHLSFEIENKYWKLCDVKQ